MPRPPIVIRGKIKLKDFDSADTGGLEKATAKKRTRALTKRIAELQELLYAEGRHALLILFQGLDASGKDGAVRKVLHYVNPAGVETANFKVPSAEEKAHDFLWRVHKAVPRLGNIGIFNRSHYEAVLVERILGDLSREVREQRYRQIVDFERMLAENNVVMLKFYLHLGRGEQARRLRERLTIPKKRWKFSSADLETRKHWDDYLEAYEDAINATSHTAARWHVVPADHNWVRNHIVAQAVVDALESLNLKWPKPKEDLSKIKIR